MSTHGQMVETLTVAAVQMTSTERVDVNLDRATELVRQAAAYGAQLVVLPENFGYLGPEAGKLQHAQDARDGAFVSPFRELARSLQCAIVLGSIPESGPDLRHVYNTSVLVDGAGEVVATYRKVHLFDVDLADGFSVRESDAIAAGDATVVAPLDSWAIGMSICYDLRFPEIYRSLGDKGAQIVTVPAAFTLHTGKDHWDVLLRARAIENQCYVIAAGQFGHHGGNRNSWGKSQIIDPWGTVLALAPEREAVAVAVIDAADIDRVRNQVPCLNHRRPFG